jgi:hypothetical protein
MWLPDADAPPGQLQAAGFTEQDALLALLLALQARACRAQRHAGRPSRAMPARHTTVCN